ncbi:MAG: hypothetical protein U5K00_04550 [Melioribacteraceae bacterium]|nr:hypothetical protein [Melioribacteraceae bacterium]
MSDNKHKRALFFNSAAKVIIYSGGIATIIAVLGILFFVFNEAYPLFKDAISEKKEKVSVKTKLPLLVGVDEYQEIAYVVTDSASIDFIEIETGQILSSQKIDSLENKIITSTDKTLFNNNIAAATDKGSAVIFKVNYDITFDQNSNRIIKPGYEFKRYVTLDTLLTPLKQIAVSVNDNDEITIAGVNNENKIFIYSEIVTRSIFGDETIEQINSHIQISNKNISAIEIDASSKKLIVGTDHGAVYYYSLDNKANPELIQKTIPFNKAPIVGLSFIIGDQSVIVTDAEGNTCSLMKILDEAFGIRLAVSNTAYL